MYNEIEGRGLSLGSYTWRTTSKAAGQADETWESPRKGNWYIQGGWKGTAETDLMVKWMNKACFLPLWCLTACTLTWCHISGRPWKPCAWGTAAHKNLWLGNSNHTASKGRKIQGCIQTVFMDLGTGKCPANLGAGEEFPAALQRICTRAGGAGQRISIWQAWIIILLPPRSMPWSVITIQLVIYFVVKTVTHGNWVALILLEVKVVLY